MRILWIAQKNFQRDLDVSTWLEMADQLRRRGHQVTLVGLRTAPGQPASKATRFQLRQLRVLNCFPLVSLTFHLQILWHSLIWTIRQRPDIILTHPFTAIFLWPAKMLVRLGRLPTKFVLDIRTLPVRQKNLNDKIKHWLIDQTIKLAKRHFDGMTLITPVLRQLISQRYRIEPETIGIWMSGVNSDLFSPDAEPPHPATDCFTVMYHGVLAENRGLVETIQAMAKVREHYPQIKLRLLGQGPAMNQLERLIQQLNLSPAIELSGAVPYQQMPAQIAVASVGIIPLPDEPCWQVSSPLKLFEYLAMARPVILSPIAAHQTVIGNCPAAFFLKSTTPTDIAAGIIAAYLQRTQLGWRGQQGRQLVLSNFTWERQAKQLDVYLRQILNSGKSSN
ncbi:MAG: glycosyltransferase family 4 protein [candidate division KSB1 bacterium]|nr:glycosyltransferase family 4 protein [candidate division KSB1 bacterium]